MEPRKGLGVMTMRHFLFYLGVAGLIGITIGLLAWIFDWSNGLSFAVAVVACTISFVMSVRESLFEGFRRSASRQRRSRHA